MKNANIDVHGVYSLFNTGGIEVHIEEGYDPFILWRYSIIDTEQQRDQLENLIEEFVEKLTA